jgi:putative membrane protein
LPRNFERPEAQVKWFLFAVALLHAAFMVLELFPWRSPLLLAVVSKKLPDADRFTPNQRQLVATIVHNAGIYNGILAGGLWWAAMIGEPADDVARVLLAGAAAAGIFGTVTMKSAATALQAALGIVGLLIV